MVASLRLGIVHNNNTKQKDKGDVLQFMWLCAAGERSVCLSSSDLWKWKC